MILILLLIMLIILTQTGTLTSLGPLLSYFLLMALAELARPWCTIQCSHLRMWYVGSSRPDGARIVHISRRVY